MSRDWDPAEFDIRAESYRDVWGATHDLQGQELYDMHPGDLGYADMVLVTITYPNGDSDTRWFAGPFDDWADLYDDVIEWYENGTP